jgi:hypothetical protein
LPGQNITPVARAHAFLPGATSMSAGLGLDGERQKPWAVEDIIVDLPDDVVQQLDRPSDPGEEGDFAAIDRAIRVICAYGHANGWVVSFQKIDSALERFQAYQRLVDRGDNVRNLIRRTCASVKRSRSGTVNLMTPVAES